MSFLHKGGTSYGDAGLSVVFVGGLTGELFKELALTAISGGSGGDGEIKGVTNLENNLDTSKPELQVIVNQEKAMMNGLVPAQVAITVADAVKGKIVTRVEDGGVSTDVRVVYRAEDRNDTKKLEGILLKSPLGRTIPVSEVAEVKQAFSPVSITRENQKGSAQIKGLIEGRDLGSVPVDVNNMVADMSIPDGYTVKAGGASQLMSEGFGGLNIALMLAVLLIYLIMASQFESPLHPFTILLTMPLAVIGVVAGLFVTGYSLGITAMIGIIILAGIVVNNGIALVDFINQRRRSGMELTEAIVEAGRTRRSAHLYRSDAGDHPGHVPPVRPVAVMWRSLQLPA